MPSCPAGACGIALHVMHLQSGRCRRLRSLPAAQPAHAPPSPPLQILSQHASAGEVSKDLRCLSSFQEGLKTCLSRVLQIQVGEQLVPGAGYVECDVPVVLCMVCGILGMLPQDVRRACNTPGDTWCACHEARGTLCCRCSFHQHFRNLPGCLVWQLCVGCIGDAPGMHGSACV